MLRALTSVAESFLNRVSPSGIFALEHMGSAVRPSGLDPSSAPLLAVMPWLTGLPSLSLGILVCKTGIMTASTLQGCWEDRMTSYTQGLEQRTGRVNGARLFSLPFMPQSPGTAG